LSWAKIETGGTPSGILKQTELSTNFSYDGQSIKVANLDLSLGHSKVKGHFEARLGKRLFTYDLLFLIVRSLLRSLDINSTVAPGAVTLKGQTEGQLENLKTNTSLSASGLTLPLNGTLKNILENMTYDMQVAMSHSDMGKLLG